MQFGRCRLRLRNNWWFQFPKLGLLWKHIGNIFLLKKRLVKDRRQKTSLGRVKCPLLTEVMIGSYESSRLTDENFNSIKKLYFPRNLIFSPLQAGLSVGWGGKDKRWNIIWTSAQASVHCVGSFDCMIRKDWWSQWITMSVIESVSMIKLKYNYKTFNTDIGNTLHECRPRWLMAWLGLTVTTDWAWCWQVKSGIVTTIVTLTIVHAWQTITSIVWPPRLAITRKYFYWSFVFSDLRYFLC